MKNISKHVERNGESRSRSIDQPVYRFRDLHADQYKGVKPSSHMPAT